MKILLTFAGFHDPYAAGLIDTEELPGPILSLLKHVSFNKIVLFSTPRAEKNTKSTSNAIAASHPGIEVKIIDLPLNDPTDYMQILKGLRSSFKTITDNNPDAEYFVSVASGTPQMHACWLLLALNGEIPARILHIRPRQFVTKCKPLISEIDLSSPDFPVVKPNVFTKIRYDMPHPDIIPFLIQQ